MAQNKSARGEERFDKIRNWLPKFRGSCDRDALAKDVFIKLQDVDPSALTQQDVRRAATAIRRAESRSNQRPKAHGAPGQEPIWLRVPTRTPDIPAGTVVTEVVGDDGKGTPTGLARRIEGIKIYSMLKLAAYLIQERLVVPPLRGEPVSELDEMAIFQMHRLLTGVRIDQAWIEPYLDEVLTVVRERAASELRKPHLDDARVEDLESRRRMEGRPAEILKRVRRTITSWPVKIDLPVWACDERLITYLLHITSPGGGGGPKGLLKAETVGALLANPEQLAQRLEALPAPPTDFPSWTRLVEELRDGSRSGKQFEKKLNSTWSKRLQVALRARAPGALRTDHFASRDRGERKLAKS